MSNIQSADIPTPRKRGRPRKLPNTPNASHQEPKPLAVTFRTAKQITGLGLTTLWALAKTKRIDVTHVGKRALISYASLCRLVEPTSGGPNAGETHRRRRPRKIKAQTDAG